MRLKSELSVTELIELAQEIAALYGPKATAALVMNAGSTSVTALVTPRPYASAQYPKGGSWIELFEAAERDSAEYVESHREMVAADLGIDA